MEQMRDIGADAAVVARLCVEAFEQISDRRWPQSQAAFLDACSVF